MPASAFRSFRRFLRLSLMLAVLTAACMPQVEAPTPTNPPPEQPVGSPTAPFAANLPGDVIQRATQALAQSLGVDVDAVALISMQRQDYPTAALGCPQPGEVAAAVVTPAYRIVLGVGASEYELHTSLDGTLVRCLPTSTPVVNLPSFTPEASPMPTPDDRVDQTVAGAVADALAHKDYDRLKAAMPGEFWLGFYGSEAGLVPRQEAIDKLEQIYLGPGLVRVYPEVSVDKLLPDWTSAAPYSRFIYSTGWGESQKDDAILLLQEQADEFHWAGLFYIFDGLKGTAYGDQMAQLPRPPSERMGIIVAAIEEQAYDTLRSLLTAPFSFSFYSSEPSQLSPEAFIEALERDYMEPGPVQVRFDVDVARLLPDWAPDPPCDEALYSTGWGADQADDGILCLRAESGGFRWSGLLYISAPLKETAYAEPPPDAEGQPAELEGMIYIPAGPFLMGSSAAEIGTIQAQCLAADSGCNAGQFEDEAPQRQVTVSAYYIDETEVTVAEFKAFVAATGYRTTSEAKGDPLQYTWRAFDTPERQEHPVRWMTWHDANAYCQWAGKRLPTEAEWEKAARGAEGWIFPWGNTWDEARVPRSDTAAVTAFPNGASPYGVMGLAGGVWEWVADWYDPLYYQYGPAIDPKGPGQTRDKVLRGGAFDNANWKQRAAHRHSGGAQGYAHDHGFRCAKDEQD